MPANRHPAGLAPSGAKCALSRAHPVLSPRFSTVNQKESKHGISALIKP
jgi:hypothetical protein